jgi:peptide chain release factor
MVINFGVTEQKANALRKRMADCGLLESDITESFIRSGGPGGQKVNKTASCVYLKHEITGLEVKMQESRGQLLNRYYARKRLCELLEAKTLGEKSPQAIKAQKIRRQKSRRSRRSRSKIDVDSQPIDNADIDESLDQSQ